MAKATEQKEPNQSAFEDFGGKEESLRKTFLKVVKDCPIIGKAVHVFEYTQDSTGEVMKGIDVELSHPCPIYKKGQEGAMAQPGDIVRWELPAFLKSILEYPLGTEFAVMPLGKEKVEGKKNTFWNYKLKIQR